MFLVKFNVIFFCLFIGGCCFGEGCGRFVYEPVTKGRDLKWDTLPQNQTPSKLFSVLPLESGMFQVTISIIKKWF